MVRTGIGGWGGRGLKVSIKEGTVAVTPFPVRDTLSGLVVAFVVITIESVMGDATLKGVKVTFILQVVEGAREAPQVLTWE